MPTQKIFKRRVRARMTKTGERYTSARRQVLARVHGESPDAASETPANAGPTPATYTTSTEAVVKATGRTHEEWFALLDAWGAMSHTHTQIAAWLADTHDAPPWWRQSITVDYERARGVRGRHQMADGFSVSVTRTVAAPPDRALGAFTDDATCGAGSPTRRCNPARRERSSRPASTGRSRRPGSSSTSPPRAPTARSWP